MREGNPVPAISLKTAVAVVVASMVGTGVFTSLGFQVKDIPAGFPIVMLWVAGGLVSLCGAVCYAELVAMMPRSGGEYHLLSEAWHPLVGFLAGWVSIIAGFAAPAAAAAVLFGSYVHDIWPVMGVQMAALMLVWLVAAVQGLSLRSVERFQVGFTLVKIGLIIAFLTGAWWNGKGNWSLLLPGKGEAGYYFSEPYAVALVFVMYAYTGWNGAVYVAGEVEAPQRNLPRALWLGTLGVMVLYVMVNAVFLTATPWEAISGQPQVALIVARQLFGERGGNFMGMVIAFGLIAHVSAMVYAGSRVLRVLGQDVWFMSWLARSNLFGAPWRAVGLLALLTTVMTMTGTFEQLLLYVQGLLLLSSLLCVAAVMALRWRSPEALRPFRLPLYPLPPLVFLLVGIWMLWALVMDRPVESAWGLLTLLTGALLYGVKQWPERRGYPQGGRR